MFFKKRSVLRAVAIPIIFICACSGNESESASQTTVVEPGTMYSSINVEDYVLSGNRLRFSGTTDLPEGTEFLISVMEITGGDIGFYGQSKATVDANGTYTPETFGPPGGLLPGLYEVEVSMSCLGQSDEITRLVGRNGEYLEGDLVEVGEWATCLVFVDTISIGGDDALEVASRRHAEQLEFNKTIYDQLYAIYEGILSRRNEGISEVEWGRHAQAVIPQLNELALQVENEPSGSAGSWLHVAALELAILLDSAQGLYGDFEQDQNSFLEYMGYASELMDDYHCE